MKAYTGYSTRQTPQSEPIPGKTMAKNNAGGFAFEVTDWTRLDRFLILGTETSTYYVGQREITRQNAQCVFRCITADGIRTVNRIIEISESGRAPKNDPALFALAMCASLGDVETKQLAIGELNRVARIGTHLFHFVAFCKQFRSWGRLLSAGIKDWYLQRNAEDIAYQVVKYQSRDGWSHRDLLRLSHPKTKRIDLDAVFGWITQGKTEGVPAIIEGFEKAKKATSAKEIVSLVGEYNLPRECIPTEFLTEPCVWEALLEKMPMTAMVRNLATMTRVGLLAPMSDAVGRVVKRLHDNNQIKKARVHPIAMLAALKTYAQGHGERGRHEWTPVSQIIDALDDAFYLAFQYVEPTGKRFYLACDVSGSMDCDYIAGIPGLTPRMATGALAMVTAKTESNYYIAGFSLHIVPLDISRLMRLGSVCRRMAEIRMGATDCSLPMIDAMNQQIPVDVFVIYTDNETWAGRIHPCQALCKYREKMGIAAKLIVVGMTATEFSIADPNDGGSMDVVGFDTAVPELMRQFVIEGEDQK